MGKSSVNTFFVHVQQTKWRYNVRIGVIDVAIVTFRLDNNGNTCSMWGLYVSPPYRRHGLATLLIRSCIDDWQRSGRVALWLKVATNNVVAIKLYKKLGFVVDTVNDNTHKTYMSYRPKN